MTKILSIINRANEINKNIKDKIASNIIFEEGFKISNVFIISSHVRYELEQIIFIVEIKDEDDYTVLFPTTIKNTYGKIAVECDSFDFSEDKEKYLDIFRAIDFTELETIMSGYKAEQEILFDLLNVHFIFNDRKRISKVVCSPLFNGESRTLNDGEIGVSIKVVGTDDDFSGKILIILKDNDLLECTSKDDELTADMHTNLEKMRILLTQFFIDGLPEDIITKKVSSGKKEMEFVDTIKPLAKESVFDKINKFLKKILNVLSK